jgi:hypothetical protein
MLSKYLFASSYLLPFHQLFHSQSAVSQLSSDYVRRFHRCGSFGLSISSEPNIVNERSFQMISIGRSMEVICHAPAIACSCNHASGTFSNFLPLIQRLPSVLARHRMSIARWVSGGKIQYNHSNNPALYQAGDISEI